MNLILLILFISFFSFLLLHYFYFYLTLTNITIFVKKKYISKINGINYYFICDDNNKLYTIGFCLWKLIIFESIYKKNWELVEENKKYTISIYGFNIPFINNYQNIISFIKKE